MSHDVDEAVATLDRSEHRPGTDGAGRPLRADAERNRQRVLAVALEVFAERGADAGFDEIARRAGVGVGTVYRRFPRREDLLVALFHQRFEQLVRHADEGLAMSDAWAGLTSFAERALQMQVNDRGLRDVIATEARRLDGLAEGALMMTQKVDQLLVRAKAEGSLRADVEVQDLAVLMGSLAGVSSPSMPDLWRRYLPMLLAGLRADAPAAGPLPLTAPSLEELDQVMQSVCGRRG